VDDSLFASVWLALPGLYAVEKRSYIAALACGLRRETDKALLEFSPDCRWRYSCALLHVIDRLFGNTDRTAARLHVGNWFARQGRGRHEMTGKAAAKRAEQFIPVPATFVVSRWCIKIFVRCCPFCGRSHWHGGSSLDDGDPRDAFNGGDISSRCDGQLFRLVPSGEPASFLKGHLRDPRARGGMERLKRLGMATSNAALKLPRPRSYFGAERLREILRPVEAVRAPE
jgi:hypothetical protein